MKKHTKIIWIIAAIAVVVGLVFMKIGYSAGAKLWIYTDKQGVHIGETPSMETIAETGLEQFQNIEVDAHFINVELIPSDHYGIETKHQGHIEWSVKDTTLNIKQDFNSSSLGSDFLNMNFNYMNMDETEFIKIYYPKNAEFNLVQITADNGKIKLGDFSAQQVEIENTFGSVEGYGIITDVLHANMENGTLGLNDINAKKIMIENTFGKVNGNRIVCDVLDAQLENGDFMLNSATAIDLNATNHFGKVTANQLTATNTIIDVENGNVSLNGEFLGNTKISTHFGATSFTTMKARDYYSCDLNVIFGTITVDDKKLDGQSSYSSSDNPSHRLELTAENGDINISFGADE